LHDRVAPALSLQYSLANPKSLTPHPTAAQAINVLTLAFPDPSGPDPGGQPDRINSSISFAYNQQQNIRTLSTNGASSGNDVTGLLYTPDLAQDDPCLNASLPYVPINATRPSNFPQNGRYALIALAPWISPTCTLSYLAAAREVQTQAFLFFMTDNNSAEPPLANDAYWSVGDGGKWKSDNPYPVYALTGAAGNTLIAATANYSGDITDVPNSQVLLETQDRSDYVRLYADIDTGASGSQYSGMSIYTTGHLHAQIVSHAEDLSLQRPDVHLRCVSRIVKYNVAAFDRITDTHVQVQEPAYQVYGSSSWSYSQSYLS
jgi:hypothetical protein